MSSPQSGVRETGEHLRILLVDDNFDSVEIMCILIEQAGHDVRVALSAEEALAIVADFAPEVAIIDIDLPMITGYELVTKLRAEPALEGCRFVALTGYSGPELHARSVKAGFEVHLTKPVSSEILLGMIAQCGSDKLRVASN